MATLEALTAQLDELEASLPQLIADYPDHGEFWMAFAGVADVRRASTARRWGNDWRQFWPSTGATCPTWSSTARNRSSEDIRRGAEWMRYSRAWCEKAWPGCDGAERRQSRSRIAT